MLRKVQDVAAPLNFQIDFFFDETAKRRYLAAFDESDIHSNTVQMNLAYYVTSCVLSTESFKLLVLFQIKGVYKISEFNAIINRLAPASWQVLKEFVDNKFRNALAHGLYSVEKESVLLFENAKLDIAQEMDLQEFMKEIKNQNILFWCMLLTFLERIANVFDPKPH
jgi:hypothetical protein